MSGLVLAASSAASGLLDTSFGTNGLALVTGGDHYEAQGAPLVGSNGKIAVAGLLKNSSDRVFLEGLTQDGASDQGFGSAGEVHTSSKATQRKAAVARLADDRIVVAGRSDAGKLQLERSTATGGRDSTFGSSGTVTVSIPNGDTMPTAIATSGTSTFVALTNPDPAKRKGFTVAKLDNNGLDSSFGTGGVATVSLGGSNAGQPLDLAITDSGKVMVTGAVGALGATASDTMVVRLQANGALDATFDGDGKRSFDGSEAGKADNGVAVLPVAGGGAYVAGSAAGKAMVAKLTSSGALDTSYAGDGIASGLAPAGAGLNPTDATRDGAGRIVVVGRSLSGSTTRWAALRTLGAGASPLETQFGDSGYAVLDECRNTSGNGPSGVSTVGNDAILIAGGCGDADTVALARLKIQTKTIPSSAQLGVSTDPAAAGHERIPLDKLDPSAIAGQGQALAATAVRHTAIRHTAVRHTPLEDIAVRHTALASVAVRHTALGGTLLSDLPLVGTTWQELLGVDVPLQTLTLEDAYNINPGAVGSLTLADFDPNATAIRHTTLGSLVLGQVPLDGLPAPDGGWCSFLSNQPYNCSNGVSPSSTMLGELEISGDDLSDYYANPISLRNVALGTGDSAAPLAGFKLADLDLTLAPFKDVKASDVASILACGSSCQGTLADQTAAQLGDATVGQLVALLPVPSLQDLTLGQALVALVPRSDIPYELTDLDRLLGQAEFRSDGLASYSVTFSVDCGQLGGLRAVLDLAGDARPVPGSATYTVGGGAPNPLANPQRSGPDDLPTYDLGGFCQGRSGPTTGELDFKVEPGSTLGPDTSHVRIESDYGSASASQDVNVDDSRDPGDQLDQSLPLADDAVRTGHITSDTDTDTFSFTGVPGKTTITLSHLPADYDLVVWGPDVGPDATAVRHTAVRHTDLSPFAVPDSSAEPTDPAILPPDSVEDTAVRHTAVRHTAVRHTSLNRGTAEEAATVDISPDEAGQTFYAQVVGYNGVSSQSPYVIRRIDRPDAPAPDCPSRQLDSSVTTPFPQDVPASTQALYLVDPARMAARDGAGDTQAMMDRLAVLAGRTNGVVVPVGDDPQVDTHPAFAAWDADPCSPETANAVVTKINEVVDHVRQLGGGLPQLRSLVVVGPDDVIPQARVPDYTQLANERDYADDATIDSNGDGRRDENAVSGALRSGYLLSDDPYGDFDPGERLWVPDVALGRLVETPLQIQSQIDAFLSSNGTVDPKRAFVTGYDFIADGATEQRDALASRVGSDATQSRIDDTWTASDAAAGIDAAGPGFLGLNAHYDNHRLLPAAGFNGSDPDLLNASQTSAPPGSVVFTVGCHAGLNLAVAGAGGNPDPRLSDWAERMSAQRRSLYAGNTGYGYGDSETVAYSERLMADYAHQLASGDVTAGQAMMFAKQADASSLGVSDDYWNKASMEATFYGLPMYRIGADGGVGDPALPPDTSGGGVATTAGGSSATAARSSTPLSLDLSSRLHQVNTDRGSYWQVDDEPPLVIQHRPIQPKTVVDVTDPSDPGSARGYLIEGLQTRDVDGSNPVIALPGVDQSDNEPEPPADSPFFPARPATVASEATPDGPRDRLTFAAGSQRDDVQRLIDHADGRILRSTGDDVDPLTIRRVDGNVSGDAFSVRVEVDGSDALGGNVLYLTDADASGGGDVTWHRANLSVVSDGVLATGGKLPSGTRIEEALVQVYDTSYNLAVSDNKVKGHNFSPPPPSQAGDPKVLFTPSTPSSGYYDSGPPQISLDKGDHAGAVFQYSIDGDALQRYDGPFTIPSPAEGEHLVTFFGNDDSSAVARFAVDTRAPDIFADADRTADANGWYRGPVTITFHCADAVSGVATCPPPVTLSGDGRNQSVSGTATDHAGHSASTTLGDINIDSAKPTISANAQASPNSAGWYKAPVPVRYSCADSLSGLDSCAGKTFTGGPANGTNDVTVSTEGANQTATRNAVDLAGNTASAGVSPPLNIDLTKPTITAQRQSSAGPNANGWYNAPVTVRYSCSDALSRLASCAGQALTGGPASGSRDIAYPEGMNQSTTQSAVDVAGNSDQAGIGAVNVDTHAPALSVTTSNGAVLNGSRGDKLQGTASDAFSGVASVQITYTGFGGTSGTQTTSADLSCNSSRTSCTWQAAPPTAGHWKISAVAKDLADNSSPPSTGKSINVT